MAACISSLDHDQYSSNNLDEIFNLPRYKRYLDLFYEIYEINPHLENHSNKRLKFSHDDVHSFNKNRLLEFSTKKVPCLTMVAGSVYLPKDNPKQPLGEDAHFIHESHHTIGVADGVGGWTQKGIDAGIYARELMKNSLIATCNEPNKFHVNPKRVLEEAYKNTNQEGSSTACIITLNSSSILAANVGDSGFFLLRKGKTIYKSPIQQRGLFGCPYQLGNCKDTPSIAQEMELNIEKDDILIVGTDGMLDNMNECEMEELVGRAADEKLKAEELASQIGNTALYNSFDRFADTPYARASKGRHIGGKIDDITVIVAYIQKKLKF